MSSPPQNTKKSVIAATFEADGESIPEANNEPPAKLAGEVTREKPASSRNQLQNTKKRIIAIPFQDDSGDEDEPNDETPVNVAQKKQFSRQELVANKLPPPRIIPVETVDLDDSTPQDDNDEPPIWKRHEQKPSLDKPCPVPKKISRPEKTVKQTPTTTTNPTKQLSTISFKGPFKKDTATTDAATDGTTPRTELRIRARKKRGLLMLSKEKTIPPPAAPPSESEPQPVWLTASPVDSPAEESFEEWYAKSVAAKAANSGGDSEAVEEQTTSELEDAHASIPEPEPEHNPTPEPESSIKERFPAKRRSPSPDESNPFKASSDEHSELDLPHPAKKTAKRHPSPSNSQQDNTSDSDSDMPPAKKRTRATSRTAKSASAKPEKPPPSTIPDFSQDSEGDDDWMGPVTTALTTTATRKATGNSGNKEARASEKRSAQNVAPKGPRISRVNKSAKSKEIFGFPIPGGVTPIFGFGAAPVVITPDVPTPDSDPDVADIHGTERQASNKLGETPTASAADITNTGTTLRDPANTHDEQPQKESTTRLANPATRGKKAASRADAAGKAPEIMVPFDPVLSPTKIAAPPPKKQLALAPTKVPQLNRSGSSSSSNAQDNKPTDLGGFTKANGGAWSRHASDLLGITRPKRGL
ncbi:Protein of unknown function (DUF2439) [Geosmithia morbida]|uniref:Uncharacterized protein n=1 Tax=Geosmithia morbida TaxID=1094350 RepID=A0A9P4YQ11_9HYPO|nr:Protein of unknown function (DUF2439) [Geosmithia morbida]KAF4119920.1 Protein of unknown function (DUF2439) [Geosmithia morbida]